MRYSWPADTAFSQRILTVEQQACACCQRALNICDHRFHRIFTLDGPVQIVCKLAHCPDRTCAGHHRTLRPLAETQLTLPWWLIGWDVFCWLGHRRFARHWSIPQLQTELRDSYHIPLSDDAISGYLQRYQTMVAARHQDASLLADVYRDQPGLILTIDGLQPEKGHETLYVVRELRSRRVWFAEALLSSAAPEVQRLLVKAKEWAAQLGKPVELWMSDKQDAFVTGIAAEFPGVPHRYCQNHFLRDVAKPVLEADSHAKVKLRSKVRGLRAIERQVLAQQAAGSGPAAAVAPTTAAVVPVPIPDVAAVAAPIPDVTPVAAPIPDVTPVAAGQVVLDYCSAVRGILNDNHGGPLTPPGLRMAEALTTVRASLQRNLDAKKGDARRNNCSGSPAASTGVCKR